MIRVILEDAKTPDIAASLADTPTSENRRSGNAGIDRLLDHQTDREIGAVLKQKEMRSGGGKNGRDRGLLCAHALTTRGECLFELPPQDLPRKGAWKRSYLQKVKLSANARLQGRCSMKRKAVAKESAER